jgi:hypothetical protein
VSLDLHKTVAQIEAMVGALDRSAADRAARLGRALAALADPASAREGGISDDLLRKRAESGRVTFLVAALPGGGPKALAQSIAAPPAPAGYAALAADGSQITADRHGPVQCFLLNAGWVALRYGPSPAAEIGSQPRLFSQPEDLVIRDPSGARRDEPIDDTLLGVKRAVLEAEALADQVAAVPAGTPMLALLDGSLVRWDLSGNRYPDHVRRLLLHEGYLAALDRLREAAEERPLAFGSYISRPRSTEVVNLLRLARCPWDVETKGCDAICGRKAGAPSLGNRECDEVAEGLLDRDLFAQKLRPGERSAIFGSQSAIVREYGPHAVHFCYINTGEEIARLEMPAWVAQDAEAVGLLHALVLDQCRKGQGYPVVLQEAHEAAVVSEPDRRAFWALVEQALARAGRGVTTSEKARSKRVRAV